MFILPLTTSYCVCEALGFEHGVNTKLKDAPVFYGLMALMILIAAAFVLTPIFSLFLIILFNGGKQLGLPAQSKISSFLYNLIIWAVIACLTVVSVLLVLLTLFPNLIETMIWWR